MTDEDRRLHKYCERDLYRSRFAGTKKGSRASLRRKNQIERELEEPSAFDAFALGAERVQAAPGSLSEANRGKMNISKEELEKLEKQLDEELAQRCQREE